MTEIIIQALIKNPKDEILLLSTLGNFNAKKFAEICEPYCAKDSLKNTRDAVKNVMKRLRVLQLDTETDFYEYFHCMEAIILGMSNLSLIVIDTLFLYYHDSFNYERFYGKPLTKEMYLNYYLNILNGLVDDYNVTVLYTLPQHIVREYLHSTDVVDSDNEDVKIKDPRNIYENMKSQAEKVSTHKFPVLKESEMRNLEQPEILDTDFKEVPEPTFSSSQTIAEAVSPIEIRITSCSSEERSPNQNEPSNNLEENLSDKDSFSDSSSPKSGEGYKSESGTESGSALNFKISEKTITTLYKIAKPNVLIKLLKFSSNSYLMQLKRGNEEFDVNFEITEKGIEWDDIPAEK